ncbi:hypothetical protein [Kosakonia radicincitans]|uniref:hypothetical protein n=1 Tax=Kosakonia radicincitans TaxID=283686 RepID=UPI0005C2EBFA|nr:hypothetical protein [Kosakonia radicincitans]KIS44684.1 hypothetical protein LG58_4051 [Kosakonia radicincitans YD4]
MENLLGEHNQCVNIRAEYLKYLMERKSGGMCFAASLFWATDALREIANDKKSIGFMINDRTRFFDVSAHTQYSYKKTRHSGLISDQHRDIVVLLNGQEKLLSKRYNYKLKYKLFDKKQALKAIQEMQVNASYYKNTAIILGTSFKKIVYVKADQKYTAVSHATAMVNYNGECFLFDINSGIFKLKRGLFYSCDDLSHTIIKNIGFTETFNENYEIDDKNVHIFIKLEMPSKAKKCFNFGRA